jgi:hypothetical protein
MKNIVGNDASKQNMSRFKDHKYKLKKIYIVCILSLLNRLFLILQPIFLFSNNNKNLIK